LSEMARFYYSDSISGFLLKPKAQVLGAMNDVARSTVQAAQQSAWINQIELLQESLLSFANQGSIYFEFAVPRVGKRVDVILLVGGIVFVLEFKVGEREFTAGAVEQVWDYALDLKNFHETSHHAAIVPVLIATGALARPFAVEKSFLGDGVFAPIRIAPSQLEFLIQSALDVEHERQPATALWHEGRYAPTPTIVEAARALYAGHSVEDISGSGADRQNLGVTSKAVVELVHRAKREREKVICFVTGVPGAGKTLVGLDISTTEFADEEGKAVYLSGNGPLVKVLQEALARDRYSSLRGSANEITLSEARRAVTSFIQNVHHFRDAYIVDNSPPHDHVAVFDEAQRAWNLKETERFMRERGRPDFGMSEPEFLISCMDRHDWAVVVCLVGGGQEINRGEAGISGWFQALASRFLDWEVWISPELRSEHYGLGLGATEVRARGKFHESRDLHLSTSIRSFRAAGLSDLIESVLAQDVAGSKRLLVEVGARYPIVITRSVQAAKSWVRSKARGSERYGLMVSSQAQRLKPLAIDVRVSTNPVHWFLKGPDDVRSSFYLEDAATEFDVQGLEVDWSCVVWDGDFRMTPAGWEHSSFKGNRWEKIRKAERQTYLKNSYRVLLTRARQGMAIVVPEGDLADTTRSPHLYDGTFSYLESLGLPRI
jgi:hypothetical protein